MAKIKSFTSLKQSRRLRKFLPNESADMYYREWKRDTKNIRIANVGTADESDLPCWSLAALLEEIPDTTANMVGEGLKLHIDKDGFQYSLFYENEYTGNVFEIETELYDNMIDACYEMIIKLHEQKLL
jgi:hypothetical protein